MGSACGRENRYCSSCSSLLAGGGRNGEEGIHHSFVVSGAFTTLDNSSNLQNEIQPLSSCLVLPHKVVKNLSHGRGWSSRFSHGLAVSFRLFHKQIYWLIEEDQKSKGVSADVITLRCSAEGVSRHLPT